jgi:hypothetical protein
MSTPANKSETMEAVKAAHVAAVESPNKH